MKPMRHSRKPPAGTFTVLLCGRKEMMNEVRRSLPGYDDIHLQFASSPGFLAGRAMFHAPNMVLLYTPADAAAHVKMLLKEFSANFPGISVVALLKEWDHVLTVDLVRMGVAAVFCLPEDGRRLSDHVSGVRSEWLASRKRTEFVEMQAKAYDFSHIVGSSPAIRETIGRAHKVIESRTVTVLITGETGTGKELLARAIHYNSSRKESPFVDIACSALPENLLESELFGYEKGAFTDAKDRKIGLFEMAGEGSIFLDEIGDISQAIQSKLLKVIEGRVMRRIGGVADIQVKARIIAATSADLERKMGSGEFRRDLYHRLKILPLVMPPLRERREDIPLLIESFLAAFNAEYEKNIRGVAQDTVRLLMDQSWEGNVRELKHAVERAVLLEEGEWITESDFEFRKERRRDASAGVAGGGEEKAAAGAYPLMLVIPRGKSTIANVQILLARKVLEETGGNKVAAARILGISRPRLDRILRLGEDRER